MEQMLEFARGTLFRLCFLLMILGLLRIMMLTLWGMCRSVRKAGDTSIPYFSLINETLKWMVPLRNIFNSRGVFSLISFFFHVGLVIVPIFLLDHILLWRRGLGVGWPSLARYIADILTVITVASGILLLLNRIFHRNTRFLSGFIDYLLLILILLIFITGYIASKPYNPVPYSNTMLVHVMCGNIIFVLIPFSKLAHCMLFPLLRFASGVAWYFPAYTGEAVNKTLYGEEVRKI
ncbi:MAG: hypothetical protein ABIA63_00985 [bacterium]